MNDFKLPLYVKGTILLIGFFVFITMLYFARVFLVPVIIAILLSIMLNPIVVFWIKKKVPRALSVLITLIPAIAISVFLTSLIFSQVNQFGSALPKLVLKFHDLTNHFVQWMSGRFDINQKSLDLWINRSEHEMLSKTGMLIGHTISAISDVFIMAVFMPLYIFLILYYKPLLLEFIHKIFGIRNSSKIYEILNETKIITQSYLIGLVIEASIVAVLYSVGLKIVGIDYAIFLGVVAAFLNIIPYLGGVIATSLFMIVAFITKESITSVFLVLLVYIVIHTFDNLFIIPRIVASKVKLNALVAITAIFAGSALWGIPGMFLSIPVSAMAKIIFDRVQTLQPWGYLMGDSTSG